MKQWVAKNGLWLIGMLAISYYALLSAKTYTWIFVSGDSGDWLASSTWWMNCQPYGSPLYILLGHFIHWVMPQNLVIGMTIGLSVIPASITVMTVYAIVKKLTNFKIATVSALVLLGAAIPLSQATVLEEYAIASMFVTLAFWFYLNDKKKLTILMLALGSAVHIIVVMISFIWLMLNIRNLKAWWKTFWIYILVGILPYSMVLILMYMDTPKLLGGTLSWMGINNYLAATDTIGSMSWVEAPKRLLQFGMILIVSLGFALVPLIRELKDIISENKKLLIIMATVLFSLWLYVTDNDPSTWTFLNFGFPLMIVLVGLGLNKLAKVHKQVVMYGACALMLVNSIFMNANTLTSENPLATSYEKALKDLPEDSFVICFSGGNYTLCNDYVLAQGKRTIPLFYSGVTPQKKDVLYTPRYLDYKAWLDKTYDVEGNDTMEQTRYLLSQNRNVFVTKVTIIPDWQGVFQVEDYSKDFYRVVGVNDGY